MKIKVVPALLACCISLSFPIQSYAVDLNETHIYETKVSDDARSVGLILYHALGCSSGVKTVYITAKVTGTELLGEIGFKNIRIQRSSDEVNWTTETTVPDQIEEDDSISNLDNYPVSVEGGYYYRVVLEHYAKEDTWWFPKKESVEQTSNSVWVPKT